MIFEALSALPDDTIVILTADVINPKPDRRQRYDWRKASTVPAGKRFRIHKTLLSDAVMKVLREKLGEKLGDLDENPVVCIELRPVDGYSTRQSVTIFKRGDETAPLPAALLTVLQPRRHRLGDLLDANSGVRGDAILAVLIEQGVLHIGQIGAAASQMRNMDEPEWDALSAKYGV